MCRSVVTLFICVRKTACGVATTSARLGASHSLKTPTPGPNSSAPQETSRKGIESVCPLCPGGTVPNQAATAAHEYEWGVRGPLGVGILHFFTPVLEHSVGTLAGKGAIGSSCHDRRPRHAQGITLSSTADNQKPAATTTWHPPPHRVSGSRFVPLGSPEGKTETPAKRGGHPLQRPRNIDSAIRK